MSAVVPPAGEHEEHLAEQPCNREVSASVITLDELRTFTVGLAGELPEDATAAECLDKLRFRMGWLENVWQACHNRHVTLETPTLVVIAPTPAETALQSAPGHSVGPAPACVAAPDRKEQG